MLSSKKYRCLLYERESLYVKDNMVSFPSLVQALSSFSQVQTAIQMRKKKKKKRATRRAIVTR